MKLNKDNFLISFLSFFFLTLLVASGTKSFYLWEQVTYLWGDSTLRWSELLTHPHGPRYALVYPIFATSKLLCIDYDFLFSYFVPVIIACVISLNISSVRVFMARRLKYSELLAIAIVYIALALMMNGRIIFALLGSSLFLYNFTSKSKSHVTLIILAVSLFLCSVSSGTLSIVIAWLIIYVFINKNTSSIYFYLKFVFLAMFFAFFGDYLVRITNKNLDFYGGGIDGAINMLSHGAGKLFFINHYVSILIILTVLSIAVIFFSTIMLLKEVKISRTIIIYYTLLIIGLSGGMFGLSTLSVSIPLVVLLGTYHYNNLHFSIVSETSAPPS
ncbi:hypothetical protein APB76_10345 [Vibrio bivalvicida]|uniref:Glycosyltransferase RgtA/B/C/D-like domain-containing protein n=1 Tax=Vibrio bivalvicida TaxID=1276888 RepID=A0A177Y085_9VIBR|nr:hypothetical protein APB76_10345 [Vibrio bivalvicida]